MTQSRSLLSDGIWLTGLQGLAVLGQLAGVRLLTDILPPAIFGEFSLWLGVVTLAAAGLANPILQSLLRYYPEYALQGNGGLVKNVACQQLFKLLKWTFPAFLAGAIAALVFDWANMAVLGLLIALITVEIARMQSTALLNAARAHRANGIWAVAEAWGRPMLAWSLVTFMGVSTHLVCWLLVVILCPWVVMRQFVPREKTVVVISGVETIWVLSNVFGSMSFASHWVCLAEVFRHGRPLHDRRTFVSSRCGFVCGYLRPCQ